MRTATSEEVPAIAPKTPKGKRTRQRILQAAAEVFREKGYGNAMVKDILARTGLARGTFYIYFKGKDEALLALLGEMMEEQESVIKAFETQRRKYRTAEEAGFSLADNLLRVYDKHSYLHRSFIEASLSDPGIMEEFGKAQALFSRLLLRMFRDAVPQGEISQRELKIISQVLVAAAGFSAFMRMEGIIRCSRAQLAQAINHIFSGLTRP